MEKGSAVLPMAALSSVIALSACTTDLAGPVPPKGVEKSIQFGNGDSYSLRTDTHIITDNRGHQLTVPSGSEARIERLFDMVADGNTKVRLFEGNASFQRCLREGRTKGFEPGKMRITFKRGSADFSPTQANVNINVTRSGYFRPTIVVDDGGGEQTCFALCTQLVGLSHHWRDITDELHELMLEASAAGVIIGIGTSEFNFGIASAWFALHGISLEDDTMNTLLSLNLVGRAVHDQGCIPNDDGSWPAGTGSLIPPPLGQQYAPGDYTGGETVDWSTARGNGGSSVCGAEARVVQVSLELCDPVTDSYKTWSKGFDTEC